MGIEPYWNSPFVSWLRKVPDNWVMLICYIRPARVKARIVATIETLCLLGDLNARALLGGPLADQPGVFWVTLPLVNLPQVLIRVDHLGYVSAVDLLVLPEEMPAFESKPIYKQSIKGTTPIGWHKREHLLVRIYQEDAEESRNSAPDRRTFWLGSDAASSHLVRGYRGDGSDFGRRGLPAYDAKMLVNMVYQQKGDLFLDPFSGVGGIVLEAKSRELKTFSLDIDPILSYGLNHITSHHCIADALRLPFRRSVFNAIATEPPYHHTMNPVIPGILDEMSRVLLPGGKLAVFCSDQQADIFRKEATALGLNILLDAPINRKGVDVVVLTWQKKRNKN